MQDNSLLYSEAQAFSPWVYSIFVVDTILLFVIPAMLDVPMYLMFPAYGIVFPIMLILINLLFMRTAVTVTEVTVTFGALFPLYIKRIPIDSVAQIEPVRYEPLKDYGGWGIRGRGGKKALNARGDLGVLLTFPDDRLMLLGTQKPHELAEALKAAAREVPLRR